MNTDYNEAVAKLQAERERLKGWEGVCADGSAEKFLKRELGYRAQRARELYRTIDCRRDPQQVALDVVSLQAEERVYADMLNTIKDLHLAIKGIDEELARLQSISEQSEPASMRG